MTYSTMTCKYMKKSGISISRAVVLAIFIVSVSLAFSGCKKTVTGSDEPAAPQSLQITVASLSSVIITWIDASDNETGFVIEMDPYGAAGYSEIASTEAGVTTYTVTGLDPDDNNRYRVHAVNNDGVTVGHYVEDFSAYNQNNQQVSLYDFEGDVIMLNFGAWM